MTAAQNALGAGNPTIQARLVGDDQVASAPNAM